uniref:Uncharacterized protein n=1 Tax=Ascaris lumbricoides TaxID=6252 RepID=A0A0M3IJH4_ASCLU
MGQLGKQLYQNLHKGDQERLAHCLDNIGDEKDMVAGAQCLISARIRAKCNRQRYTKWVESLVKMDPSIANDQYKSYEGDFMTTDAYKHLSPLRDLSNQIRNNRSKEVKNDARIHLHATATSNFIEYFSSERVHPQVTLPTEDSPTQNSIENSRTKALEEIRLPLYSSTSKIVVDARNGQQEMPMQDKNIVLPEGRATEIWIGPFHVEGKPRDIKISHKEEIKRPLIGRRKIEGISRRPQIDRSHLKSKKPVKSTIRGNIPRFYPRKQWCSMTPRSKQQKIIDKLRNGTMKFMRREWAWQKSIFAPSCITTYKYDFGHLNVGKIGFRPRKYRRKRSPHRLIVNEVNKSDKDIIEVGYPLITLPLERPPNEGTSTATTRCAAAHCTTAQMVTSAEKAATVTLLAVRPSKTWWPLSDRDR